MTIYCNQDGSVLETSTWGEYPYNSETTLRAYQDGTKIYGAVFPTEINPSGPLEIDLELRRLLRGKRGFLHKSDRGYKITAVDNGAELELCELHPNTRSILLADMARLDIRLKDNHVWLSMLEDHNLNYHPILKASILKAAAHLG